MKRGSLRNRYLDRYIGIPILYGMSLFRRKPSWPNPIQKIGLVASPTLGDTLLSSAPVIDLRRKYPDATFVYFAWPSNRSAAQLLPGIDQIIDVDIMSPIKTIRAMRAQQLDLLIDFTPWQRITAFYSAVSKARFRIGFQTPSQHRHWNYDWTVAHSSGVHEVDNFRSLIKSIGVSAGANPQVKTTETTKEDGCSRKKIIVFHPWASGERGSLREWPAQNWTQLAKALTTPETLIIITGGPSEIERSEHIVAEMKIQHIQASAYMSTDGLASLCRTLKSADLVVSVNTGIMHLAAILGTPTIALNGPTATHRWGPIGKRAIVVEPDEGPRGYLHLGFEFDNKPNDCMRRIRVGDVVAAIKNVVPHIIEDTGIPALAFAQVRGR